MEPEPLIFRTNISCLCTNCELSRKLDAHPGIERWSLDREDIDKVLWISGSLSAAELIQLVAGCGYSISEL